MRLQLNGFYMKNDNLLIYRFNVPLFEMSKEQFLRKVMSIDEDVCDCIFCNIDANRVLLETDNFTVMACAGPIMPGYCILSPNKHIPSFAQIDKILWDEISLVYDLIVKSLVLYSAKAIQCMNTAGLGHV